MPKSRPQTLNPETNNLVALYLMNEQIRRRLLAFPRETH